MRGSDGVGMLEIEEPFDRAWRRVGLALDRVGFTVEDRDRAKGLYFVRYVDPESDNASKSDGFFSKLLTFGGGDAKPRTQYRIFVRDAGSQSTVQVLTLEGGVDQSATSRKILGLLHEQLK
jgi:outer membrane protein assembly factor BamC